MTKMIPTVGRIVLYTLNEQDIRMIERQRGAGNIYGSTANVGDVLPAHVVKVWGDTPEAAINIKVELDGPDSLWITSRQVAAEPTPGMYHWMDYQKDQAKKHEEIKIELDTVKGVKTTTKTTVVGE